MAQITNEDGELLQTIENQKVYINELRDALEILWRSLSCLPCSSREFVGDACYRKVQEALYDSVDDDEEGEEF